MKDERIWILAEPHRGVATLLRLPSIDAIEFEKERHPFLSCLLAQSCVS